MNEIWTRRALYFAGLWNVIGGAAALMDPARHLAQMYGSSLALHDPMQAFFFRATWINVIAWGVGYLLAARMPWTRPTVLMAGGAGKLAYFAACFTLYQTGGGSAALLATGALDVFFAALFFKIAWTGKGEEPWAPQA